MDVLFVQFTDPGAAQPLARFDNSLGVAAAMTRDDGFTPHLVSLPGYDGRRLHAAVTEHRPRYAVVDIHPCSVTSARRAIAQLGRLYALPVAVIGRYATCMPKQALSIPGTEAVIVGEYEQAVCDYLLASREDEQVAGLPGIWINGEEGLVPGEPPDLLTDLDALPLAERELFDYGRIVQAGGELHFRACRGCPRWCSYCVNDWYMDLHAGRGQFVRRRGVGRLLEEVAAVAAKYPQAARVRFYDHAFADDLAWLREFAAGYRWACPLPYRCHVRPDVLDAERASLLGLSGCRWATVPLVSGSSFIREEVFGLQTEWERIASCCQLLRQAGVAVTIRVLVGAPYESEITVEETARRLDELSPDAVEAEVFYPVPGSRVAELCQEAGWLSGRGEEHFWQQSSTLDMPSLPARRISEVARDLGSMPRTARTRRLSQLLARIRHMR